MKETLKSSSSTAVAAPGTGEKNKLSMSSVTNSNKLANVGHVLQNGEARSDDVSIQEDVHFSDMYLNDDVLAGLRSTGFYRPSPVQLQAIPSGRCGLDLIVQAKSGTGKTCVFTVLALEMVAASATTTQVLVIAPTREIAVQIASVMTSVGRHIKGLKVGVFIGGTAVETPGVCHIAVGTPGRLHHMLTDAKLCGRNIRLLVLDEADQMLDSFRNEVQQIVASLPHSKQVVCASATYTPPLQELAKKLMRSPVHVTLGSKQLLAVTQYIHKLPYTATSNQTFRSKLLHLKGILGSAMFNQCLIFTNSIMKAESVCDSLKSDGWPVACLCGGQTQKQRLQALDDLVTHRCRVLVATDLAARGLDSPHVSLVVSLEAPPHPHTYLHRVGRAGRFGAEGVSVVLAQQGDDWLYMQATATMLDLNMLLLPEPSLQDLHQWQEKLPHLTKDQMQQWASSTNRKLEAWKMDSVRPQGVEPLTKVIDTVMASNGAAQNRSDTVLASNGAAQNRSDTVLASNGAAQNRSNTVLVSNGAAQNRSDTVLVSNGSAQNKSQTVLVTKTDPSTDGKTVSNTAECNVLATNENAAVDSRFVTPEAAIVPEIKSLVKTRDDSSKKDDIVDLLKVNIGSKKMIHFSRDKYLKELVEMEDTVVGTSSNEVSNYSHVPKDLSLPEQRVVRAYLDAADAACKTRTTATNAAWSSLSLDPRDELEARARGLTTAAPASEEKEDIEGHVSGECKAVEDSEPAVKDDFSFHIKVMNEETKLNKELSKKFLLSKSNGDNLKGESVKTKKISGKKAEASRGLLGYDDYDYNYYYNYDDGDDEYWSESSVERDEYGDPLPDQSNGLNTYKESQKYYDYHDPYAGQNGYYNEQYTRSAASYGACGWGPSQKPNSEYYGYNDYYYDGQSTSRPQKTKSKRRSARRESEVLEEEEPLNDGNYDYCLPGYPDQAQQGGNPGNSFQPVVLLDRSNEIKTKKDKTASKGSTKNNEKPNTENVPSLGKGIQSSNVKSGPSDAMKQGVKKNENFRVRAGYNDRSKSDLSQNKRKCEHPGCSSYVSSSSSSEESGDEEVEKRYNSFNGYNSGSYYTNNRGPSYPDHRNSDQSNSKGSNMKGHCQGCCCSMRQYPGSLSYMSSLYQFTMMNSFVRAMGRASSMFEQQMRREQALWQSQWGPAPATHKRRRRHRARENDVTHGQGTPSSSARHGQGTPSSSARHGQGTPSSSARHGQGTPSSSARQGQDAHEHDTSVDCSRESGAVRKRRPQTPRRTNKPRSSEGETVIAKPTVTAVKNDPKPAVAQTKSDTNSKSAATGATNESSSKPADALTKSDTSSKSPATGATNESSSKPADVATNSTQSKPAVVQSKKKGRKKQNKAK